MPGEWPFVGRSQELAQVDGWLARGTGAVIAGDAGTGKTALARHIGARAHARGARVEWIAGRAARTVFPFEAFSPVLQERPAPPGADAVADRLGLAPAHSPPADRPVLVVDDAHLLDQASADVLLHLSAAGTVRVVAVTSTGERAPDAVRRLWLDGSCERLDLAGLPPAVLAGLMEAVLGGQLDRGSSAKLIRAAAGNLLFLRELLGAALREGLLVRRWDVWQLQGEPVLARSLHELIGERLIGLSAAERSAAELLAAGEPLPEAVAVGVAGEKLLDALIGAGLAVIAADLGGPVVTMAHPLYGAVLRDETTPLRARRIHLKLARALEHWARAQARSAQPGAVVRAALWRLAAGDLSDPPALLAAARAARSFGLTTAQRLARAAVAAGGSIEATLLLAEILTHSGQLAEADALTAGLPSGQLRPEDAEAIVYCQVMGRGLGMGDLAGGITTLAAAGDTAASPRLRSLHALLLLLDGRLTECTRVAGGLMADPDTPADARVSAAVALCPALLAAGRYQACLAACSQVAPLAAAVAGSVPFGVGALTAAASLAHLENGSFGLAEELALAAHEQALRDGDAMAGSRCAQALGRIALMRGQLSAARRWFRETVAGLGGFDQVFLGWNLSFLARAAAAAGAAAEAAAALADAAQAPQMGLFAAELELARAAVSAAGGKLAAATESAALAAELAAARGQWGIALIAGHDAARWGAAPAVTDVVKDAGSRVDGPLAACLVAHTVGLAATDPGRLAEVSGQFETLGALLHAGEAAAAAGRAFLRSGRRAEAARVTARAALLLARCDDPALPWLAGIASAVPLTGREQEVAVQAAAGLPDAVIARELAISVRTVQTHLARVYTKLGIRDRRALPAALWPGAFAQKGGPGQ